MPQLKRCRDRDQLPKKKRRVRLKKHRKRYELVIPGQRLQLDVKYTPMKVEGKTAFGKSYFRPRFSYFLGLA
jgi:hypothetical protein